MDNIRAIDFLRMTKKQKLEALASAYKKAKTQAEMIEIKKYIYRVEAAA